MIRINSHKVPVTNSTNANYILSTNSPLWLIVHKPIVWRHKVFCQDNQPKLESNNQHGQLKRVRKRQWHFGPGNIYNFLYLEKQGHHSNDHFDLSCSVYIDVLCAAERPNNMQVLFWTRLHRKSRPRSQTPQQTQAWKSQNAMTTQKWSSSNLSWSIIALDRHTLQIVRHTVVYKWWAMLESYGNAQ